MPRKLCRVLHPPRTKKGQNDGKSVPCKFFKMVNVLIKMTITQVDNYIGISAPIALPQEAFSSPSDQDQGKCTQVCHRMSQ